MLIKPTLWVVAYAWQLPHCKLSNHSMPYVIYHSMPYIPSHIIKKYTSECHTGGSLAKLLTCTVFLFAARKDNTYKWVGRLISISICNGGEAGNSLAPCLNLIAIGEHACSRTVNDVPSIDVRNTLE